MSNNILGFSGSIGSGKSTLSAELAKTLKYKYASFGMYVRKLAVNLGYIDASRSQLQEIGEALVRTEARSFCQSVLQAAEWSQGEGLIIDGIRHLHIWKILHHICAPQKLFLIYILVDENIRRERVISRDRDKEFTSAMRHSTELQVKEILRLKADLLVDGNETVEKNIELISNSLNALR